MGESTVRDMFDEARRDLAIREKPFGIVRIATPTAEMNLVDRQRRVERQELTATLHPGLIVPLVLRVPDDRSRARRRLGAQRKRVGSLRR